jgi:hypothetical protein
MVWAEVGKMTRNTYCPGALIALYRSGFDRQQAAAALGIARNTLLRWEVQAGLRDGSKANRGRRMSNADFARLWNDPRVNTSEIAEMLGVSVFAVCQRAKTRGLRSRSKAGACFRAHRKMDDPGTFRAMWSANVSNAGIGDYFGVCPQRVGKAADSLGLPRRNLRRVARRRGLGLPRTCLC